MPDKLDFESSGLHCVMRRGPAGNWCGYVAIPKDHPWHGKQCGEIILAVDVHGGLTYSADHKPDGKPTGQWWFGFDCAHTGDHLPSALYQYPGDTYRDADYVKAECESLAAQLAAVKRKGTRLLNRRNDQP